MVSTEFVEGWAAAQACVFGVLLGIYAYALYYYDEVALPRFQRVLQHALLVSGLTALLYAWLLGGGDEAARWVVYAATAPSLVAVAHTYLTCPASVYKDKTNAHEVVFSAAYRAVQVLAALALLAGAAVVQAGLSAMARWALLGAALALMLLGALLFSKAIFYVAAVVASTAVYYFLWFAALVSLAYPVLLALSPALLGTISADDAHLGYLLADLVTKLLLVFFVLYSLRKTCDRCEPRPLCAPPPVPTCLPLWCGGAGAGDVEYGAPAAEYGAPATAAPGGAGFDAYGAAPASFYSGSAYRPLATAPPAVGSRGGASPYPPVAHYPAASATS